MDEKTYVILTGKSYESLLKYLASTQVYEKVATLISEVVNDANKNNTEFNIIPKISNAPIIPDNTQSPNFVETVDVE